MRLAISVAIAGLLCFSTYVSAQPNIRNCKSDAASVRRKSLLGNTALPYWIPTTKRRCSITKITTALA
jgi:hypothetical protein